MKSDKHSALPTTAPAGGRGKSKATGKRKAVTAAATVATRSEDKTISTAATGGGIARAPSAAEPPVLLVSRKEVLKKNDFDALPEEHQANLTILLEKVNRIRTAWGKPMIVTSGYRSMQEHLAIYKNKGITDISKIPMKSKHLRGQAVDISDPKRELQAWCRQNQRFLKEVGVWMEDFAATSNWVHFQIEKYGSYKEGGSLWFKP